MSAYKRPADLLYNSNFTSLPFFYYDYVILLYGRILKNGYLSIVKCFVRQTEEYITDKDSFTRTGDNEKGIEAVITVEFSGKFVGLKNIGRINSRRIMTQYSF